MHNLGRTTKHELRPNTVRIGSFPSAQNYTIIYEHEFKYPKYR